MFVPWVYLCIYCKSLILPLDIIKNIIFNGVNSKLGECYIDLVYI